MVYHILRQTGAPVAQENSIGYFRRVYHDIGPRILTTGYGLYLFKNMIEVVIISNVSVVLDELLPIRILLFRNGFVRLLKNTVKALLPAVCTYPLETLHIRQLQQYDRPESLSTMLKRLWEAGEMRQLYRGFSLDILFRASSNLIAAVIHPFVTLAFKSEILEAPQVNLINQIIVMGALYPLDTLRKRVQAQTSLMLHEETTPLPVDTMNPMQFIKDWRFAGKPWIELWNGFPLYITYILLRIYGSRLGSRFISNYMSEGNMYFRNTENGMLLPPNEFNNTRTRHEWANQYTQFKRQ